MNNMRYNRGRLKERIEMAKFECSTLAELREKERKAYATFQSISKIRKEKEEDENSDENALTQLVNLEYFNRGIWSALCDLIEELEAENE